jgi:hypothetical protein
MPNWHDILHELQKEGSTHDIVRRRYLRNLYKLTGRNVILYYSGWLQKPDLRGTEINDYDKNGFMTVINRLDKSKGLDLFLHTPGGATAATESLVDYLHSIFGSNIRAVVPQLAMSGGTMMACACKEIVMGKHSSLGPIDPQYNGLPAHGIIEEILRACDEIKADPAKIPVWQPIIAKYHPTLVGECEKSIQWSNEITKEWLLSGMLKNEEDAEKTASTIITELADHALTKSHARHLSAQKCANIGLKILHLEDDSKLQDAVLSVHHACMHTLGATSAYKLIENHMGVAFIQLTQQVIVRSN